MMNTLHEFDKKMNSINEYETYMTRIVKGIFVTFAGMIMLIPDFDAYILFCSWGMLIFAITFHLRSLTQITIDRKVMNLYPVLKHTPLPKEVWVKSRCQKYCQYLFHLGILCITTRTISFVLSRHRDVFILLSNLGYYAVLFAIFTLLGIGSIKRKTRI